MRVGIVTFQRVNNYGAVLQMYALYRTIRKMGIACDVIDYRRDNLGDVAAWQKNKIKALLRGCPDKQLYSNSEFVRKFALEMVISAAVNKKFDRFRKHISFSRSVNKYNIQSIAGEYDCFISGSDQVWNCGRVNFDTTYMLDFVADPDKKISYAASFGIREIPGKYRKRYRDILQDYSRVSLREKDGVELFKGLTGREDASLVLDPSMLLKKEEWKKLAKTRPAGEPYIFVYQVGASGNLLKFAAELARIRKCRLLALPYVSGSSVQAEWCFGKGPREWLGLLMNASCIVTNSFHGMAFSINFEKEFFVEISKSRTDMQSRISSLLSISGLEDRLITDHMDIKKMKEADYRKVNEKLDVMRAESVRYLCSALKGKG